MLMMGSFNGQQREVAKGLYKIQQAYKGHQDSALPAKSASAKGGLLHQTKETNS